MFTYVTNERYELYTDCTCGGGHGVVVSFDEHSTPTIHEIQPCPECGSLPTTEAVDKVTEEASAECEAAWQENETYKREMRETERMNAITWR